VPGNAAVPLACGFVELWALPEPKEDNVATRSNLTPLQEAEARRLAAQESKANKVQREHSEEEKALRKKLDVVPTDLNSLKAVLGVVAKRVFSQCRSACRRASR
jgi:hypothetical protein